MTAAPTQQQAVSSTSKIPRDLAISAAITSLLVSLVSLISMLLTLSHEGNDTNLDLSLNHPYIVQTLSGMVFYAILSATLVWLMARGRIEAGWLITRKKAIANFTAALLILMSFYWYMAPNYYQPLISAIDSWFQAHPTFGYMTLTYALLVAKLIEIVCELAIVAISFYIAYFSNRHDYQASRTLPAPTIHTVPVLCSLLYVSLLWIAQDLIRQYLATVLNSDQLVPSYIGNLLGGVLVFGVAYWGARMGAGKPSIVKPLKILAATLSSFIVQLCLSFIIGVVWMMWHADKLDMYSDSISQFQSLFILLTVVYFLLLVALMRWFTGMLYERIQN